MKKCMSFPAYILLVYIGGVFAADVQQPDAEAMHDEICSDMRQYERKLDTLIQTINDRYRGDTAFLSRFSESQQAWRRYYTAQIMMKFPAADTRYSYGKLYPLCICLERIRLCTRRIEELQPWKEGVTASGEECPGSILQEP